MNFSGARRDLADDLNKVQRTSGWVAANLDRFAVPETTKRRSLKLKNSSNQNSGAIMNQQQYHQETTTTSTTSYQRQNSYGFQYSPLKSDSPLSSKSSLSSTGSSRLQAFEGDAWKHSPRTGTETKILFPFPSKYEFSVKSIFDFVYINFFQVILM